jgi:hypothetical protein
MRMRLRDLDGRDLGTASADPSSRPPRVTAEARDGRRREVYLDWERALDDAGCLRKCVACGCGRLYRRRTPVWFSPFALVLASAGVVAAVMGHSSDPLVLGALIVLVLVDVAVLAFVPTRLVCYRCGTSYRGARVARMHRAWDPRVAASLGRIGPELDS